MFAWLSARILTPMGWSLLAAGVISLFAGWVMGRRDLLYIAIFAIALLVICTVTIWLTKPRFSTRRSFSLPQVQAGQACTVHLEISSDKSTTTRLTMREELPSRFGQAPTFVFPSRFASAEETSLYEYRVRCSQRGFYSIGPVSATFTDPFGLAKHEHTVGEPSTLVVTPPIKDLSEFGNVTGGNIDGVLHSLLHATASQDDVMTREYRHGDSMRRVHWPATARLGELMVRQEDNVTTPQALIVMDRRDSSLSSRFDTAFGPQVLDNGLYTSSRFEWLVTMAASISAALLHHNYQVRMMDQRGTQSPQWTSSNPRLPTLPGGAASGQQLWGEQALEALLLQLAGVELLGTASTSGHSDSAHSTSSAPREPSRKRARSERSHTGIRGFDQSFLHALANVRGRGPLIALLGDLGQADLPSLEAAVNYYPHALAILCLENTSQEQVAVQRLRAAGWRTVIANDSKSQSTVWNSIPIQGSERTPDTLNITNAVPLP